MTTNNQVREAPETAFQSPAGRVQFAAVPDAGGKEARIKLVARSGEAIEHWYWGRIVHDLAGMRLAGDKVGFDWCHYSYEGSLGFGDKFDITSGDLVIEGLLVSFQPDDRSAEIIHKGQKGVPYESSIFFDPCNGLRMEFVPDKMSATVNGRQIDGPCVVVREWLLRGVAICPYGADPNTSTEFAKRQPNQINVTLFSVENAMTKTPETKPAETNPEANKLAADPAVTSPPTEKPATPDASVQLRAELGKFVAKFGAENGSKWFTEGKTFAESCELHMASLTTQLATKETEIGELKGRIAAVNTGEKDPLSFSSSEKKDQPGQVNPGEAKFAHLGSGLAKFAAGIKLPVKA